jgi:hypothetical protein
VSLILRHLTAMKGWFTGRNLERAVARPQQAQEDFLMRLIHRNAATAFGREHGFDRICSPADFAAQVPIRDYDALSPWIDRAVAGERQVLTVDPILMFGTTSGTTERPKLIPVTARSRRCLGNLTTLWAARAQRDHPGALRHSIFTVVSPAVEGYTDAGVPIGSISGLTRERMPWFVKRGYANPAEVSEISDYDTRYLVTIRLALGKRVSLMVTPNPSSLLRIAQLAARNGERIVRAIHDGNLGWDLTSDNPERAAQQAALQHRLEARIRPDPDRARRLEEGIARSGALRPMDAWPDLSLLGVWLGGSCGVAADRLREWYGDSVPMRDIGLRATECMMTLPLSDDSAYGVPCLRENYFEFIPEDAAEDEHPPVLGLHQLEEGQRYYILVTTPAGLWRYDINDIVEVRGNYRGVPLLGFTRKGREMANITGEKVHVNQVLSAAADAATRTGFPWTQIRLIPNAKRARYDLLLEPQQDTPADPFLLEAFGQAFDSALGTCNAEWQSKRDTGRLHSPLVHQMHAGWSERQQRIDVVESGKRDSQYKWQVIVPEWTPGSRREVQQLHEESNTTALSMEGVAQAAAHDRKDDHS